MSRRYASMLSVSLAFAASSEARADAPTASTAAIAPVYQGVALDSDRVAPSAHGPGGKDAKGSAAEVRWIGFQRRAGVPTIFVQLSRPVAFSVSGSGDTATYTLVGARVPQRNNLRALDVSAFGSALQSVEARRHGHDTEIVLHQKGSVTRHERIEDGPAGSKFLVIELVP